MKSKTVFFLRWEKIIFYYQTLSVYLNIPFYTKTKAMKILKKIFFVLLGLIILLLIAAVFIPKKYTVSESLIVNVPKDKVFEYVKLFRNQEEFSVWILEDPGVEVKYTGEDGTLGAIQSWNGKNSGIGEQEITFINNDKIEVELRFKKPFESKQKAALLLNAIDSTKTEVKSEFYGSVPYPMNLMSFVGKKIIRDAEVKNLANIKRILESKKSVIQ